MKRVMTVLGLSVAMVLSASIKTGAQSKKKGKGPELAICKRGKLIFEDDFSGKDLMWTYKPDKCDWKVMKGMLATKSTGEHFEIGIQQSLAPLSDAVSEFRLFLPTPGGVHVSMNERPGFPLAGIERSVVSPGRLSIITASPEGVRVHATSPFSFRKSSWINVIFEKLGPRYALTVGDRTITYNLSPGEEVKVSQLWFMPIKKTSDIFAIDDVKVYEALPKDEGENEDEKGKKKK
ncbi:MAG: hypothetical protein AB1696_19135 [Planctomycetota bacterium]